jgi:hypothetical protein
MRLAARWEAGLWHISFVGANALIVTGKTFDFRGASRIECGAGAPPQHVSLRCTRSTMS